MINIKYRIKKYKVTDKTPKCHVCEKKVGKYSVESLVSDFDLLTKLTERSYFSSIPSPLKNRWSNIGKIKNRRMLYLCCEAGSHYQTCEHETHGLRICSNICFNLWLLNARHEINLDDVW